MAKQVSPGVLALRKVVDDVYADAREAKKQGKLVGWSSSKFPCELAEAFDLNVMYPENQAAGIAAQRDGEIMCQAAEDLGCNSRQVFTRVTLPLSVPGIVSGITMVFVPAVSTFYISQKLGSPGTILIGDVIESQFKAAYNPNLGAAMSLVLMVLVFVCVGIMNRFTDEDADESMVTL